MKIAVTLLLTFTTLLFVDPLTAGFAAIHTHERAAPWKGGEA